MPLGQGVAGWPHRRLWPPATARQGVPAGLFYWVGIYALGEVSASRLVRECGTGAWFEAVDGRPLPRRTFGRCTPLGDPRILCILSGDCRCAQNLDGMLTTGGEPSCI